MQLLHARLPHQNSAFLLVACAFVIGGAMGYAYIAKSDVACHTMSSTTPVPDRYGAAYNLFSPAKELLINASCGATNATISVGNGDSSMYIHNSGYEWRNNKWNVMPFTGTAPSGTWFLGSALARVNRTSAEMNSNNYVVAYTCQKVSGVWKCGCRDVACTTRYWQLQNFTKPAALPGDLLTGSNVLIVAYPTPFFGPRGSTVTLSGSAFSTTGPNTVIFGGKEIQNLTTTNKTRLTFTVPFDAVIGELTPVTVRNNKGTASGTTFMVTRPGTALPTVTSVTPERGKNGSVVTIKGTGFAAKNTLISTFGVIKNVPSTDGLTMQVKLEPLAGRPEVPTTYPMPPEAIGKTFPDLIYVANENGISKLPVTFTLVI